MSRKFIVILCAIVLVLSFAACETKNKCARCGKTEDEANLYLFDASVHPNGDGKYYCSNCFRSVVSETPIPGVADEIERVIEPTESTSETIYQPLAKYVGENVTLMGTIIAPSFEYDVNKDGYPDLCSNVTAGSGIISHMIAVYDVHNQRGYLLSDRGTYDYQITGCSDDAITVCRSDYMGESNTKVYGTLLIVNDQLNFMEETREG